MGFVTLGVAFGIWYSFPVFLLVIVKEFGWSRAATSSIFSLFILSHALTGPMALLFAILFGLGYGAAAPLLPSVSADIFLGKSFGLVFAMICIGGGAGGSTGSFLTGLLRDIFGSYSLPFSLFYFCLSVSCILIWLAGPRKVRRMIRQPVTE